MPDGEFFANVSKIVYEGPDSMNPLAFHYYTAEEVIMGKPMKEWCARQLIAEVYLKALLCSAEKLSCTFSGRFCVLSCLPRLELQTRTRAPDARHCAWLWRAGCASALRFGTRCGAAAQTPLAQPPG